LKTRSRSTKSVVGVATGSGPSPVMLNCLAHMEFFILGVLLEWEWMLLFSDDLLKQLRRNLIPLWTILLLDYPEIILEARLSLEKGGGG